MLVAHRLVNDIAEEHLKNSYEFKVRWLGYDSSEDTWLPWKAVRELKAMDEYLSEHIKLAKLIRASTSESELDKQEAQEPKLLKFRYVNDDLHYCSNRL